MSNYRSLIGSNCALLLAACAAPALSPPDPEESVAVAAAALSEQTPPPLRIDQMTLQLTEDGKSGRLVVLLDKTERKRVLQRGEAVLSLPSSDNAAPTEFNDLGKAPDLRANDGQFSALIPVDFERLRALNQELSQTRQRTIPRFAPGTREVIGRDTLPTNPIDLEKLRAGAAIRLPRLAEFGPIRILGGGGNVTTDGINPQKSLLIRALPVIEDGARTHNPCAAAGLNSPLKSWTFGHLMEQMSQGSGLSPSDFVENWLDHWRNDQTVNDSTGTIVLDGVSSAAGPNIDALIIDPWRRRSGGGALNLSIAPFRLQAILYRPDLGTPSSYTGFGNPNAGELRFVFGLMVARDQNRDGDALDVGDTCQATEMAVIFEYGVPRTTCGSIKNWANEWVNLSSQLPGSPAFNGQLETLTESVVTHGAAPSKPNMNALNQLRTNEIDLTGIWQFREFHIRTGSGPLDQVTTRNNPREHQAVFTSVPGTTPNPIDLNHTAVMTTAIPAICGDAMPETHLGNPFLGGASSYNGGTFWDDPGAASDPTCRFRFSLNTCSGCHTGETATSFYHIRPTGVGSPPTLSAFLLNNPHSVTDNRGVSHDFNEMDNRKQALANLANQQCGPLIFPPFHLMRLPLLVNVH